MVRHDWCREHTLSHPDAVAKILGVVSPEENARDGKDAEDFESPASTDSAIRANGQIYLFTPQRTLLVLSNAGTVYNDWHERWAVAGAGHQANARLSSSMPVSLRLRNVGALNSWRLSQPNAKRTPSLRKMSKTRTQSGSSSSMR